MKRLKQSLLVLSVMLMSGVTLMAATATWTNTVDINWATAGNWDPGVPGAGDDIVFPDVTGQTVDLGSATIGIGTLTFNAADDYTLQTGTLTLGGNVTQSGSGAVTNDISLDLGGATRSFGGTGAGIVRFNGSISGAGAGLNITGGSYALAAVNGFDGGLTASGGTVKIVQPGFGNLFYQPTFDGAGGGAVTLNGGRVELIAEDSLGTIVNKRTTTFGASGGTLVYSNFNNQIPGNTANQNVINGPATIVAYPARLSTPDPTGSSANDNLAGAFQLQQLQGSGQVTLVLRNGAAGRFQIQDAAFAGSIVIDGEPGADVSADQSGSAIVHMSVNNVGNGNNYQASGGIFFKNYCQLWMTHSNERKLDSDVTVLPNSGFAVQGRPSFGSDRNFVFGNSSAKKITIQDTGLAQMDLQVSRWVNPRRSVIINSSTFIEAGGTLRFTRTYHPVDVDVRNIDANSPITGQGTATKEAVMDLFLAGARTGGTNSPANGVTFNSGANLVVNGSGTGGLRIQAKDAAALQNLLTTARLNALTGSGGTLTLALTNTESFTIPAGPSSASAVALGLDSHLGSSPTYILGTDASMANFAGLVLKGSTARVSDASTVTMQTLTLAGVDAAIQLGNNGASGSVLNFANSSAVAWNAGTLYIVGWGGNAGGGGSDQIKFGSDATGLTAGQLAQITWIAPNGGANVVGAKILASGEIVPYVPPPTQITSPAMVNGEFVFTVAPGVPGQTSIIQWATNIAAPIWVPVLTNTGAFNFTNTLPYPEVFYRVLVP